MLSQLSADSYLSEKKYMSPLRKDPIVNDAGSGGQYFPRHSALDAVKFSGRIAFQHYLLPGRLRTHRREGSH